MSEIASTLAAQIKPPFPREEYEAEVDFAAILPSGTLTAAQLQTRLRNQLNPFNIQATVTAGAGVVLTGGGKGLQIDDSLFNGLEIFFTRNSLRNMVAEIWFELKSSGTTRPQIFVYLGEHADADHARNFVLFGAAGAPEFNISDKVSGTFNTLLSKSLGTGTYTTDGYLRFEANTKRLKSVFESDRIGIHSSGQRSAVSTLSGPTTRQIKYWIFGGTSDPVYIRKVAYSFTAGAFT